MKKPSDCFTLSNNVQIPCIGFGTWQTPDGDVAYESVKAAIKAGYTHIETIKDLGDNDRVIVFEK